MSEGMKMWAIGWFSIMFILVFLELLSIIRFNKREEEKRQERISKRLKRGNDDVE